MKELEYVRSRTHQVECTQRETLRNRHLDVGWLTVFVLRCLRGDLTKVLEDNNLMSGREK